MMPRSGIMESDGIQRHPDPLHGCEALGSEGGVKDGAIVVFDERPAGQLYKEPIEAKGLISSIVTHISLTGPTKASDSAVGYSSRRS